MSPEKRTELRHLPKRKLPNAQDPLLTIRAATISDAGLIRKLIVELAEYDKEAHHVRTTKGDIERDGFGADPQFRALIAEWQGKPAGFAVFFNYYSTWRGAGLYLEDLFVRPDFRGRGIGTALLAHVARIAQEEDRGFVRWVVLNWNQPAVDMYTSLGAHIYDEWRVAVLTGDDLRRLVRQNC